MATLSHTARLQARTAMSKEWTRARVASTRADDRPAGETQHPWPLCCLLPAFKHALHI